MRKTILAMALSALIPAVSIAVAQAEDYDDEDIEFEEYEEDEFLDDEDFSDDEYTDEETETNVKTSAENRNVTSRVTCKDIKKEMDRLNAMDVLDENAEARLAELKTYNRSHCMKSASGRLAGRKTVNINVDVDVNQTDSDGMCDTPDANGCCPGESYVNLGAQGFNCCTANNERCFPPMQVKKDFSLCDDGTKPDKNGCCKGEKYTNLGDLGFNCCLGDGVTCFPPIK